MKDFAELALQTRGLVDEVAIERTGNYHRPVQLAFRAAFDLAGELGPILFSASPHTTVITVRHLGLARNAPQSRRDG